VNAPPAYSLRSVSRQYGGGGLAVRALDGVDLEVAGGEFVAVAGPSGSGKSTLLQLLGALDRPSSGEVLFEGRDLARASEAELAELRLRTLGFVFQQFNLIPTLTAAENIEIALAPAGLGAADRRARTREVLARVGLGERLGHLPSQLSGGEQQRVAIGRALANRPRVVLADEPTGNLDSATGDAILALLYRLWEEEGLTVVLITHDPAIASTAPMLVRLADGGSHPRSAAGRARCRSRSWPDDALDRGRCLRCRDRGRRDRARRDRVGVRGSRGRGDRRPRPRADGGVPRVPGRARRGVARPARPA
jgi:putative ABC transport system ATP-binding protein